jgi:hypothetical protein
MKKLKDIKIDKDKFTEFMNESIKHKHKVENEIKEKLKKRKNARP